MLYSPGSHFKTLIEKNHEGKEKGSIPTIFLKTAGFHTPYQEKTITRIILAYDIDTVWGNCDIGDSPQQNNRFFLSISEGNFVDVCCENLFFSCMR